MEALTGAREEPQVRVTPTPVETPPVEPLAVPSMPAEEAEEAEAVEAEIVAEGDAGESPDALALPVHSVRAEQPGARGCWAVSKRTGDSCGAAAIRGADYCAAHSGLGVSADPKAYVERANEARRESLRVRAEMRLALGATRSTGPRAALRARAFADAERLAEAAFAGARRDPRLALAIIREVDPPVQVAFSGDMPTSEESVNALSLSDLMQLAQSLGINPSPAPPAVAQGAKLTPSLTG